MSDDGMLISDAEASEQGLLRKVPPTAPMLSYAHRLLRERAPYGLAKDAEESNGPEAAHEWINSLDKEACGEFIRLMRMQKKRKVSARTSAARVGPGVYKYGDDIYSVERAHRKSRHLLINQLVGTPDNSQWVPAPGILHHLREEHRLTLEQAQRLGRRYRRCMVCGMRLNKKESIGRGMGKPCAESWQS